MSQNNKDYRSNSISEEEISAFADGALPPRRARQVAQYVRLNPQAAQKIFDTWCIESELLDQIHAASGDEVIAAARHNAMREKRASSRLPWLSGVAAGGLLVLGLWALSLEQNTADATQSFTATADDTHSLQADPIVDEQAGAALVRVAAVTPEMNVPDLEVTPQQITGETPSQETSGTDFNGGNGEQVPPGEHLLPKSPHPAGEYFRLNFQGGGGVLLTLEGFSLPSSSQATLNERIPERLSDGVLPGRSGASGDGFNVGEERRGRVHWNFSDTLYVLSGNLTAAELFATAMQIREQQKLQWVPVAPRATETIEGRGASGMLDPASREAAPGFSKM